MKLGFIVFLVIFSYSGSIAQSSNKESSRDNSRAKRQEQIDRGATYGVETNKGKKKKIKYSISKDFDQKIEEYEKRMELNAKKYKKMAKEMEKPQYSDPTYFGHKKKPKKRPPGKKKFCKECKMFH